MQQGCTEEQPRDKYRHDYRKNQNTEKPPSLGKEVFFPRRIIATSIRQGNCGEIQQARIANPYRIQRHVKRNISYFPKRPPVLHVQPKQGKNPDGVRPVTVFRKYLVKAPK
jgi:hypothetical protein